jgi:arylsulfatase
MKSLLTFAATLLLALNASAAPASTPASPRPNVLVILTDDIGYGDFSCTGNPVIRTPNLDKFQSQSVRFTDFHVSPMCTPTRGELLSGLDALRNGASSVTAGRALLKRGIPTAADLFAAGGYRTGIFGKWHLGDNYPYRPNDRGFQEAVYFRGWGLGHSAPEIGNDYWDGRYFHNGKPEKFTGYCTDFWFDTAKKWMKQCAEKGEPFFCYLPTNAAHAPLWVDQKYSQPYLAKGMKQPVARFFGMIANIDDNMAMLDAFLAESGLRDNTIVIFMTDNGGTAGVPIYNAGMRGHKTENWEGGHRVPCWVRWPAGKLRSPSDINVPTQVQDILPTLLELTNVTRPTGQACDGVSLAGLLRGTVDTLPDRTFVVQYGQNPEPFDSAVVWGKWRLVFGKELYDIHADPGQMHDIAADHADVVAKMRGHYEAWWKQIEPGLAEYAAISLGSSVENPVELSCSDWQKSYCDNNKHVMSGEAGGPQGMPWTVNVEQPGEYTIALRRWPQHIDAAITAPLPKITFRMDSLEGGRAIAAAKARLRIADQDLTAPLPSADAREVVFTLKLPAGRTLLQGWFQDASGGDICGAYYATVTRR